MPPPRLQGEEAVLARAVEEGSAGKSDGSTADESDSALAVLAGRGDGRAFRALVDRHIGLALAIGRRMLRDDAEAEDVAQEAMLRLWRSGGGLELGEHGLKPWLRRVVSNLCIDKVRQGRRTTVVEEVPDRPAPPEQFNAMAEKDLSARVDDALKALPERQRLALTLFHYEGLSQADVAHTMGISDEAVESLLARARRALKAALQNEWRQMLPDDDGSSL